MDALITFGIVALTLAAWLGVPLVLGTVAAVSVAQLERWREVRRPVADRGAVAGPAVAVFLAAGVLLMVASRVGAEPSAEARTGATETLCPVPSATGPVREEHSLWPAPARPVQETRPVWSFAERIESGPDRREHRLWPVLTLPAGARAAQVTAGSPPVPSAVCVLPTDGKCG